MKFREHFILCHLLIRDFPRALKCIVHEGLKGYAFFVEKCTSTYA
jgi:hypothetical protein